MSKLTGRIDRMGRPIIRLENKYESFLALVDTGFNGQLMVNEIDAQMLGFITLDRGIDVGLATEQSETVSEGIGLIDWMGEEKRIRVLISSPSGALRRDDDPIAIIGTGLLSPDLLEIDFAKGTVTIESQKTTG